ncbi:MAG: hypothetical protein OEV44_12825 [Spirochaetota bacterium]|nr:hypothetical protein [Spirochaetota bacterium]
MKKYVRNIILLISSILLVTGFACKPKDSNKTVKEILFLKNAHWSEKKAEYQKYNYKLKWYDTLREAKDSIMILVKEGWNSRSNVKSDNHHDSSVLKFSTFDVFNTGTYPYSFKSDIFFDINNGEVVKYTMGSQDGCGNHFFRYDKRGTRGTFTWHSYWNDHGLIAVTKPTSSFDTFFDALPVYLRFRLSENTYKIKAVQPLIANRPLDIKTPAPNNDLKDQDDAKKRGIPNVVDLSVTNTPGENYNGKKVIKSVVVHGDKTDTFYFAEEFPHTLEHWKGSDEKTLVYSKFYPYWLPEFRNKPEGNLPQTGEQMSGKPKEKTDKSKDKTDKAKTEKTKADKPK